VERSRSRSNPGGYSDRLLADELVSCRAVRSWIPLLLAACAAAPHRALQDAIPLEAIFDQASKRLPRSATFSHDGERVFYLRRDEDEKDLANLWVYDIGRKRHDLLLRGEGLQKLTTAQRAARERRRERGSGIGRFHVNPKDDRVLIPISGDLHLLDAGKLRRLTETKPPERNPRWSPDGESIAFVRDEDVWVLRDGRETRVSHLGEFDKLRCGLPEFIAMEELGRHEGFWWSPDSASIAYVVTDSRAVPTFFLHDYLDVRGKPIEQEYPRAGDANVKWTLMVVPAGGGKPVRMAVQGEYLVRVDWMPDGALAVQVSDRPQRRLTLYRCDPATGEARTLLEETSDTWVRVHRDLHFLGDGRFLWTSERSGRRHLYLWEQGKLRALTSGDWDVAGVLGVGNGVVDFTGSRESPRERHLYRVAVDGTGLKRLTREPGWHGIVRGPDGRRFVDTYSRADLPPTVRLLEGGSARTLAQSDPVEGVRAPEFLTVPADDGTPLHAMLFRARGSAPGPALIYCYGGPESHLVSDRWSGHRTLWHTRLTQLGYTVMIVDGRGSGGYGLPFSRVVSGRLCDWEVRDQAAAARWLAKQGYGPVGIWGWSYGGTLTLMCLLHAPDAFAAGVSIAPVTDWRDYDTAYTERYLGVPQKRPEAYALSSPITEAARLRRPAFLAHGFMDDNVHFRGAVAFVDSVQKAGRTIETDFYPRGAHGIGDDKARRLLFGRIEDFMARHLPLGK